MQNICYRSYSCIIYLLELWSKDDMAIIASRIGYSWIYNTGVHPINFAGTHWTFNTYQQYLYAKGPIDQPVVIKVSVSCVSLFLRSCTWLLSVDHNSYNLDKRDTFKNDYYKTGDIVNILETGTPVISEIISN